MKIIQSCLIAFVSAQSTENPAPRPFSFVHSMLNVELDQFYKYTLTKPRHIERMERIHLNLFAKWESLMTRCKNGDMLNSMHASFWPHDVRYDPDIAESVWKGLMESSFEVCDLPVTKRGFPGSSWERRISRYFKKLNKLFFISRNSL